MKFSPSILGYPYFWSSTHQLIVDDTHQPGGGTDAILRAIDAAGRSSMNFGEAETGCITWIHPEKISRFKFCIMDRKSKFICSRCDVYKLLPVSERVFPIHAEATIFHIPKTQLCFSCYLNPLQKRHRLQGRLGLSYQAVLDARSTMGRRLHSASGSVEEVARDDGCLAKSMPRLNMRKMKNVAFQFPKCCFNVC